MRAAVTVALAQLALASFVHPAVALAETPQPILRVIQLMGTRATLVLVAADRVVGLRQLEDMVRGLEQTEAELSTWRRDSVLSRVNRQPVGEALTLPAPICSLWDEMTRWHRATGGAFDPAVGALAEAWGLRDAGHQPSPGELAAARAVSGFAHFWFDASTCAVTRPVAVSLDAGAFGKGEALRRLLQDPAVAGTWMVDLGGQIAVSNAPPPQGWPVAIAHPAHRSETAVDIVLRGGSLATSGASERTFDIEGGVVTHLLDPRTGRPIHRPESVTVWHADPLVADILSTALYVLGPEAAMRYGSDHDVAVLVLTPSTGTGRDEIVLRASPAFRRRFPSVDALVETAGGR